MVSSQLRVLIVDDSAVNRQRLVRIIEGGTLARVVGTAADGAEALRAVSMLHPDVVTLDLAMPQMDGFSFLRLLKATRPTPVIVVSGNDQKENVFKALELGAIDFVSKVEDSSVLTQLLESKLEMVRSVRHERASRAPPQRHFSPAPADQHHRAPRFVIAVASSTGGPTAVTELLSRVHSRVDYAVLIAQHMPPKFTTTFAQRLDRYCALRVAEAKDGDNVYAGRVLVCPGDSCMRLVVEAGQYVVRISPPAADDRYVPNASQLLSSVGRALGPRAIGVVLTGMGDDGAEGASVIAERGGQVIVESEQTAVVYGMPRVAASMVPTAISVPLPDIAARLMDMVGY